MEILQRRACDSSETADYGQASSRPTHFAPDAVVVQTIVTRFPLGQKSSYEQVLPDSTQGCSPSCLLGQPSDLVPTSGYPASAGQSAGSRSQ